MDTRHPRPTPLLAIMASLLVVALGAWPAAARAQSASRASASGGVRLVADSQAPLTPAQLARIEKFIDAHHRKATIDPEVAKLLGFGKGGKPVVAQQVSLVDKGKKERHLFDRLEDKSGFIVGKRSAGGLAVYRLSNDLTWMASVMWRKDGNKVALRSTDGQAALRQELALWAAFADRQH